MYSSIQNTADICRMVGKETNIAFETDTWQQTENQLNTPAKSMKKHQLLARYINKLTFLYTVTLFKILKLIPTCHGVTDILAERNK